MLTTTARTFKSGNSEAVRLPKGFGFGPGAQVQIERDGNRVVLTLLDDEAERWRRDAARLAEDLRAARGADEIEREVRDTDWWPERAGL
ncbi:MAG: AbrB/MazE/SpoVT family DNA-binding domain-containing protein [Alphaproteobacteria bacterium]|nr:AbrB/MazE/SpoVT family DNA-binding domain-containing protein [Alphaproteobacteria bacterium]